MNSARQRRKSQPVSLVTGVAGFIGMHVAAELVRRNHKVIGLDDLSTGFRDNVPAEVEFTEGSVVDPEVVSALFQSHRVDFVFHLAAYAAEGFSHFVRRHTYRNNVLGSVNLINAAAQCRTVRCFVFTSSVAVYGDQPRRLSEDAGARPIDPYGISKHAVELDLRSARAAFGLPSITFRLHNVYGEGQNLGDPHRNVIGIFMRQILEGNPLPIYGDGSQTRAFTYISEVAPVIAGAVDHPALYNGVFNLGSNRSWTILTLADKVAAAMQARVRFEFLPARLEAAHPICSHARIRKSLPNLPAPVELETGLERMAAWAKRIGVRPTRIVPPSEVQAYLPRYWRVVEGRAAARLLHERVGSRAAAPPIRARIG